MQRPGQLPGGEGQVRPSVPGSQGAWCREGPGASARQHPGGWRGVLCPGGGWWITAGLFADGTAYENPSLSSLSPFHNLTVSCSRLPPYILSAFLIVLPGWGDDASPAHCEPRRRQATSRSDFIPDAHYKLRALVLELWGTKRVTHFTALCFIST